jgi:hypothetical protein
VEVFDMKIVKVILSVILGIGVETKGGVAITHKVSLSKKEFINDLEKLVSKHYSDRELKSLPED